MALLACTPILLSWVLAPTAAADAPAVCRVINIGFTPGGFAAGMRGTPAIASPEITPQIVAWLETPAGQYVQTVYITQQTGRYGLGNRPGRFDFNSGPRWPYGRRVTVFPVWASRHGVEFPQLEFQETANNADGESHLSHSSGESSREMHYCQPLLSSDMSWDAATCSSPIVYTDKGRFSTAKSSYPPRADVIPSAADSMDVQSFKALNQFDAVSQATPALGQAAEVSWPIPVDLKMGDYVLMMEVSLEQDFNTAYPASTVPSPEVSYGTYGVPYVGQPSVLYKVPFTISGTETIASTDTYAGYADPAHPGTLHAPDATITSNVANSGASRLMMTSKGGEMYRVRVDARPEADFVAPGAPGEMVVSDPKSSTATLTFAAPGDDGMIGTVKGYEVRYLAGDTPFTAENFAQAHELTFTAAIAQPGQPQELAMKDLLPETEYTVAVRAFDDCHNISPITSATFTTAARTSGTVDACFIATAAYGSLLANDVDMLRRFRDQLLKRSVLGELAVETYYTFGPSVAGVVGESDLLRTTARDILNPIVDRVRQLRW
ncbi:MAG: fibronectin type III domain-containing protein [Kofleriaceae bacterium]